PHRTNDQAAALCWRPSTIWERNRTGHLLGGAPPTTGWADDGAHGGTTHHGAGTASRWLLATVARMEPTGRANARPMTGSAQSGVPKCGTNPGFRCAPSGLRHRHLIRSDLISDCPESGVGDIAEFEGEFGILVMPGQGAVALGQRQEFCGVQMLAHEG